MLEWTMGFHEASMRLVSRGRNEVAKDENPVIPGRVADGRCLARTGDLLLVRQALYQLS